MLWCWFACLVEKSVECVLLWPKFLDTEKTKLSLEETFVIAEDIIRAHLTVSWREYSFNQILRFSLLSFVSDVISAKEGEMCSQSPYIRRTTFIS